MIDTLPEEWKTKWMDIVPGKRFAETYELKGVSLRDYFPYSQICAARRFLPAPPLALPPLKMELDSLTIGIPLFRPMFSAPRMHRVI